ncbi:MAG: patatin-like phospholipase family protein, partial [Solirubrobacteraceae bacterium]
MRSLPDVLVLGAGGVLGEAWLSGVVAGIEDATGRDFRDCEAFLGTSAGAIVTSRLASGRRPRRPTRASRSAALALRDAAAQAPDRTADQGAEGARSLATFAAT